MENKPLSLELRIKEELNVMADDPFFSSEPPSSDEQKMLFGKMILKLNKKKSSKTSFKQ